MSEPRVLEIHIGTLEELKRASFEFIRQKPTGPPKRIIGMTPKLFAKVFTARRLELLHVLCNRPGLTVNGLARLTKRKQEAISRDLSLLRSYNLLPPGKGARTQAPALLTIRA